MAVDSKAKRFSMLNFAKGYVLLPDPDGTLGASDRMHRLGCYAGIVASVPVPTQAGIGHLLPVDRMHHTMPVNRMHHTVLEED